MKLSCDIVKDLLPLYAEDMVSGESAKAVRQHLEECQECGREWEAMRGEDAETAASEGEAQKAPLTMIKKKLQIERLLAVLCGCAMAVCVLTAIFAWETDMSGFKYDDDLMKITETKEGFVLLDFDEDVTNFTKETYRKDGKKVVEFQAWHSRWDLLSGQRGGAEVICTVGSGTMDDDGNLIDEVKSEVLYQCDATIAIPSPKTDAAYYRDMNTGELTLIYGEAFDGDEEMMEAAKAEGRLALDKNLKTAAAAAAALALLWLVFRRVKFGAAFRYLCMVPCAYLVSALLGSGGLYPSASYSPMQDQVMIYTRAVPILAFFLFCMLAHACIRLRRAD